MHFTNPLTCPIPYNSTNSSTYQLSTATTTTTTTTSRFSSNTTAMPTQSSLLLFIPNLLRPAVGTPAQSSSTLSTLTPSTLPQTARTFAISNTLRRPSTSIPTSNSTRHYSKHSSSSSPTAILSHDRQTNSSITQKDVTNIQTNHDSSLPLLPLSEVDTPKINSLNIQNYQSSSNHHSKSNNNNNSNTTRQPRKHTEESRRKIGIANRGNKPWNKGRKHTEATRRKIAEATRKAMMRPEMRQMLRARAKGRRHSEATKLKIRQTARLTRGTKNNEKKIQKKIPLPFEFSPNLIHTLNQEIEEKISSTFQKQNSSDKLAVREKRVVAPETRQKLSQRIKELWNDPEYRAKVSNGIEDRARRLAKVNPPKAKLEPQQQNNTDGSASKIENQQIQKINSTKQKTSNVTKKHQSTKKVGVLSYDDAEEEEICPQLDTDFGLDLNVLDGWTKEDLGIFGEHGDGIITETINTEEEKYQLQSHYENMVDASNTFVANSLNEFDNELTANVNSISQNDLVRSNNDNIQVSEFLKSNSDLRLSSSSSIRDNTEFGLNEVHRMNNEQEDSFLPDQEIWDTNEIDLSKMGFGTQDEEFGYTPSGSFMTNDLSTDSPFSSTHTMGE